VTQLDDAALLSDAALAALDPELESVRNINTPEDYRKARDQEPPEVAVEPSGMVTDGGGPWPRTVRAATIGAAAEAVGLTLDRHVVAALNGDQVCTDARSPLVTGDTVAFLPANAGV
jgi:molybdopterin-guanine dinucleotide biosynthesis protein A